MDLLLLSLGVGAVPDFVDQHVNRPAPAVRIGWVDVLYVAGGNTFVLLAALRRDGADAILVERVRAGLPYIGSSAGSVVAGPSIVDAASPRLVSSP